MYRGRYVQIVRAFVLFDVLFSKDFKASDVRRFCSLFFLLCDSVGERVYSVDAIRQFKFEWKLLYSELMSISDFDNFNDFIVGMYVLMCSMFPLKKRGVK